MSAHRPEKVRFFRLCGPPHKRKNWLFIGGDGGLPSTAVLMSLCASAKRHALNPWAYLTDVLMQLAAKPADVNHLLPYAWAKQHLPAGH
jgi:hypothetical protein